MLYTAHLNSPAWINPSGRATKGADALARKAIYKPSKVRRLVGQQLSQPLRSW